MYVLYLTTSAETHFDFSFKKLFMSFKLFIPKVNQMKGEVTKPVSEHLLSARCLFTGGALLGKEQTIIFQDSDLVGGYRNEQ